MYFLTTVHYYKNYVPHYFVRSGHALILVIANAKTGDAFAITTIKFIFTTHGPVGVRCRKTIFIGKFHAQHFKVVSWFTMTAFSNTFCKKSVSDITKPNGFYKTNFANFCGFLSNNQLTETSALAELKLKAKETAREHHIAYAPFSPVFVHHCTI
jgi:hypothetical protein